MGDGSGKDRIVSVPADKATGYGINAAVDTAARVVGDVVEAIVEAVVDHVGLRAAARDAPAPPWVLDARRLWAGLAASDAGLAPVVIADLTWFSNFAYNLSKKTAVGELHTTGFAAWTNSSTLVLVSKGLVDGPPELARILLRHEAMHVGSFRNNGEQPPTSYHAMASFERDAYTKSRADLKPFAASNQEYEDAEAFVEHLRLFFTAMANKPVGKSSEVEIRKEMLEFQHDGDPSPLLPPSAGDFPSSLYVP